MDWGLLLSGGFMLWLAGSFLMAAQIREQKAPLARGRRILRILGAGAAVGLAGSVLIPGVLWLFGVSSPMRWGLFALIACSALWGATFVAIDRPAKQ